MLTIPEGATPGEQREYDYVPAGGSDPLYFTVTVPEWVTAKPSAMATAAFCTNVWYLPETKTTTGVLVDGNGKASGDGKPATMAQIAILCKEYMADGKGYSDGYAARNSAEFLRNSEPIGRRRAGTGSPRSRVRASTAAAPTGRGRRRSSTGRATCRSRRPASGRRRT